MRALMYADWTVLRRTFLRYLLVTLFVMTPIVAMGSGEGEVAAGTAVAALMVAGTVVLGTALGMLIQWIIPLLHGTVAAPRESVIIVLTSLGTALVVIAFLAIEMPIVFKLGISKARMAFTVPFLLCLLINVEPVRNAIIPVLESLEAFACSLGSPAPLFAGAAVIVALLYLGSMRVSESIYAARDF